MAKNKDNVEVTAPEVALEAPPLAVPVVPLKLVSFETWAKLRNIKPHHMPGMKAFIPDPNKARPVQTWDSLFSSY